MGDPKKISEADCAYLAALIDQCGHVNVRTEKRRTSTYRTIFLKLQGLGDRTAEWLNESPLFKLKFYASMIVNLPDRTRWERTGKLL